MRQQAETSRLLGVDFVVAARERSATDAVVEVKPATPGVPTGSAGGAVVEVRGSMASGDDERSRRTRALEALRERYEREAPHKAFVTGHTRIVFGEGDPCARLMFVGEAPGQEEDRTGRPFVGRAGQLLDKMIGAMGLARGQVYIANVLKTRPPNNATPTMDECRICEPYLLEQVSIVDPEAIVTLGLPASRTLLESTETMSNLRGRWAELRRLSLPKTYAVMPTYHPAFLLRSYTPENRRKVWADLRLVIARLGLGGDTADPE